MGVSRRTFLIGAAAAGTAGLALTLKALRGKEGLVYPDIEKSAATPVAYGDWTDAYREKWTWDKVVKGSHNRANCFSACSWNLFVRDGMVWREEQNAIYQPSRADVPDFNPRGCQKGACHSDLHLGPSRVLYPLKRAGARGEGKWKRI